MSSGADAAARHAFNTSVAVVAERFHVDPRHITATEGKFRRLPPPRSRDWHESRHEISRVVHARRAAVYLAVVGFNSGIRSIGRAASLTAEGVRKALAAVEDLRDDPAFDRQLTQMEREITA